MGFFAAIFGRRGDGGFSGPLLGVCRGVVGFNVAMFLPAVCEICRPARPHVGASAKQFALRAHNGQKLAFDGALGEFFRGHAAGGTVPGELCRAVGTVVTYLGWGEPIIPSVNPTDRTFTR